MNHHDVDDAVSGWRSVAGGWERRRAAFWEATREVAERMVTLLAPRASDTVLELAAGPGDTGFLAARRIERLISSDVAPEMVEAARRRGAELGLDNVDYRVLDAAAVELPDASVDGILCRFGLMLVPSSEGSAREIARVLRPGGRASVAVWASPEANDWLTAAGRSALELGLLERPDPTAPGPFRLSGEGRLAEVLEAAGLPLAAVEDVPLTWRWESLDAWWETLADTSRTLGRLVAEITPAEVAKVRAGAERRIAAYVDAEGRLEVPGLARVALAERK